MSAGVPGRGEAKSDRPSGSTAAVPAPLLPRHLASGDEDAGFLSRYWAEVASRPARLVVALVATAMAPVLVIEVGTVARATAELAGRPHPTPAPPAEARPPQAVAAVTPVAGDIDSWLAGARKAAATCPGLPPEVLVAIAKVETGLGIRTDASYAGALGPMQFLPATWAAYGVDGDGDGRADVMNIVDALHGAARLLCANGGGDPHRLRTAVWNYNRSLTYVERVTALAGLAPWPAVD